MISIADVRSAAGRIAPYLRRTPMVSARCLKDELPGEAEVLLKLECLQVTGSFKPRGATNKLLSLPEEEVQRGIITASGGNHGLAVAYAGRLAKTSATVFVPENVSQTRKGSSPSGAPGLRFGANNGTRPIGRRWRWQTGRA